MVVELTIQPFPDLLDVMVGLAGVYPSSDREELFEEPARGPVRHLARQIRLDQESVTFRGRSRGCRLVGEVEVGVPALEVVGELVVEDAASDLEELAGSGWVQRICCF